MRKPVFGVPNKARLKPVSSASETSKKIEISLVASLDTCTCMILFKKRITKALIRLRTTEDKVFSRLGPFNRVGSHMVSVRIHCMEKWRTSFHTDVLSKSK